jgi:ATP adenylyltransferase
MERMWSPWRSKYIETFKKPRGKKKQSLFVLAANSRDDTKNLVVWRGKYCFVMMNRYPYNSGHLMIVPYRQVADVLALKPDELKEIMVTLQNVIRALGKIMRPHGFNFGANFGRVSGAGIDDHIHFHVVPRWNGDSNFMPVLADTKVISEDIRKTTKKLHLALKK